MCRGNEKVCVLEMVRPGDGRVRIWRKTGKYRDRTSQRVPRQSDAIVCPGRGAARSRAERCTADPGPPRTGTVPGLQRTTSCCAAPGTRERRDPAFVHDRFGPREGPTCGCAK